MKAVVAANGSLPDLTPFRHLIAEADLVVAADGGARALLEEGLSLTALVGDMDSLPPPLLARWRTTGGDTVVAPTAKDETDLELALTLALDRGARQIIVLGALGGRVDHATANMLLLAAPLLVGVETSIVDVGTRIVAVRDRVRLAGRPGDVLSLVPITARVEGVVTEGLLYPLCSETLRLGVPRGVSNVFVQDVATVQVAEGLLLAMHAWADERTLAW